MSESQSLKSKRSVQYAEGDSVIEKIKENKLKQAELRAAIQRLKEDYGESDLKSEEESLRTDLYNFMVEKGLKHYKSYKLTSCLPKEELNELNLEKKVQSVKSKISAIVPDLDDEIKDQLAIELA